MTTRYSDTDKIELKRPWGKNDLVILRKNYEMLRLFILTMLETNGEMTLIELIEGANKKFNGRFSGEILLTVKYDLEVKSLINVRRPERCIQVISLKRNYRKATENSPVTGLKDSNKEQEIYSPPSTIIP